MQYNSNGTGGFGATAIPSNDGTYTFAQTVTSGVPSAPVASLPGVPVDATNPATLLPSDRASYVDWTSGTALALPAITGNFAANFPFFIFNGASSTLTITPNAGAGDQINGAASVPLLKNWGSFIYQDSSSGPGNWYASRTYACEQPT